MKLFFAALVLFSTVSFANTTSYDLKMDLKLHGKTLPSFNVKVKEGEKASIVQKTDDHRTFIDVVTTKSEMKDHPGILMKFTIGTIGENSKRTVTSSPTIIAAENSSAMITQGNSKNGREEIALSVVAKTIITK